MHTVIKWILVVVEAQSRVGIEGPSLIRKLPSSSTDSSSYLGVMGGSEERDSKTDRQREKEIEEKKRKREKREEKEKNEKGTVGVVAGLTEKLLVKYTSPLPTTSNGAITCGGVPSDSRSFT